jgi:signal transduction histidine kinase
LSEFAKSAASGSVLLGQMAAKATLYKYKASFRRVFILALCLIPLTLITVFSAWTGDWVRLPTVIPFLVTGAFAWHCMASGQVDRGFKVAIYGAWIALAIALTVSNGIRGTSVGGFYLILALAGWFAGLRSSVFLTVATVCVYAVLTLLETNGMSFPIRAVNPSWYVFMVHALLALAAGTLGHLAAKSLTMHLKDERDARVALDASLRELEVRERDLAQAQAQLRQMNLDLEQRVADRSARLHNLTRELNEFSYSISHDLRTPLRAINGQSNLLLEEEGAALSATATRRLEAIVASSDHMGRMVDTLLVVIRLGQTEIRREPIHMKNLVTNVLPPWLAKYPAAQVEVGEMPAAQADAALVRQLIGILVENALKFSSLGAVSRVEVGWDAAQHAWFVRDNGIGFDMRYADRLWGLFEHLHGAEFTPGMGIGLTIADRIVQCHGGDIWAVSAPGEGATFFFTLNPA